MTLRCNNWLCSALSAAAVMSAAALLSSCSAAGVGESIPQNIGGLPTNAPARPATPGVYPAVNDIPPARQDPVLSVDEETRLEQDLKALKAVFPFGDPPFAVALERGRAKAQMRAAYKASYAIRDKADTDGFDHPMKMFDLTEELIRRRYSDADISAILGGNFLRLLTSTWGG